MTEADTRTLWSTSYHEAGHALIAELRGWPVFSVRLRADGTGTVKFRADGGAVTDRQRIAVYMAGPVAQSLFEHGPRSAIMFNAAVAAGDLARIKTALAAWPEFNQSRPGDHPRYREALRETRQELLSEWPTVQGLSLTLFERRTLSGADVRRIIGQFT